MAAAIARWILTADKRRRDRALRKAARWAP